MIESHNTLFDPKLAGKLVDRALKKMQGLVQGNGLKTDDVRLMAPDHTISLYTITSTTHLKLSPHHNIRIEPGRNSNIQIVNGEAEFRKAIANSSMTIINNPQKRQNIIDRILARPDKGFGMSGQHISIPDAGQDIAYHDKCTPCANTGKIQCQKCNGKAATLCPKCSGRRQISCPRCRGSGRLHTPKGAEPCQHCRADGKVNCTLCHATGMAKCKQCAATGVQNCKICAATGWMTHIAHIDMQMQVSCDFNASQLPSAMVQHLTKNPARSVEKHDVEITAIHNQTIGDDEIRIDYTATAPFGAVSFELAKETVSGFLFGYQARLIEFPFFMDVVTQRGQTSLIAAPTSQKNRQNHIRNAAKYRFIRDVIAQCLWLKNPRAATEFLINKYPTGYNPIQIEKLVNATDKTLRQITRLWRIIGLIIGFLIYTCLVSSYFLTGGRNELMDMGVHPYEILAADILLIPIGIIMSIYSSMYAAHWSQKRAFKGIVQDAVLNKVLPKAGKMTYWSFIVPPILYGMIITYAQPEWLNGITTFLTDHVGL